MSFYKYTNISTASLVLKNKSLRWSSPLIFNDLEECQFTPFTKEQYASSYKAYFKILTECAKGQSDYNINELSDASRLIIEVMRVSMNDVVFNTSYFEEVVLKTFSNPESDYRDFINAALIKCFRVLCVTEKYDNNLMWAHYADQHYGCIIEFDSVYLKKPRLLREGYVRYHENLQPQSNPLDIFLYGETEETRDLLIRDVAFSKRTSWNYEKEYRFMFFENFGEITTSINMQTNLKETAVKNQSEALFTDVSISKESVKSIIFGVRTNDEDVKKVLEILTENDYQCNLYQMKMRNGCMVKEELS
ncbi:DUF2971 domain-containing protein [Mucilaginibacter paludis]|uniref:DUF2971 domain-containing protein n=1 Tax=Mucilaginibacter paludis DSM 18603 TaxID=714943 RepID=H1YEA2_9SPHI|nr:DUF2971 domain-containing protein [Mucilaginibacter paludis]EHQ26165.1 hypothetical protein Mucpa_2025 [Mucilaginibacter paludis DSM 18603]